MDSTKKRKYYALVTAILTSFSFLSIFFSFYEGIIPGASGVLICMIAVFGYIDERNNSGKENQDRLKNKKF